MAVKVPAGSSPGDGKVREEDLLVPTHGDPRIGEQDPAMYDYALSSGAPRDLGASRVFHDSRNVRRSHAAR